MRFETLHEWLSWQERLHGREIDLGLTRVRQVLARLASSVPPRFTVVTVAGTNGKGSCIALLESVLLAAGYRVGAYTSPHLLRYNERVRIGGVPASDAMLCRAFERVDQARGNLSLTYFEFGTLAALEVFAASAIEIALLEVGLGGRLDAVNILDADIALITSIAIDHVGWLGNDRESIAREKAGILRRGQPAVVADPEPPASLIEIAGMLGVSLYRLGRDFGFAQGKSAWSWWGPSRHYETLPLLRLQGEIQLGNAAAILMVLRLLERRFPVSKALLEVGLAQAELAGRFQVFPGPVEIILDVAHNPAAAQVLVDNLGQRQCAGKTYAVVGMRADKDVKGTLSALTEVVDGWYLADLEGPRGAKAKRLADTLRSLKCQTPVRLHTSISEALQQALAQSQTGDRVAVFGSFLAVAAILETGLGGYQNPSPIPSSFIGSSVR
jgi:dihydrofolate synthase/folylpolyglutamate synthase